MTPDLLAQRIVTGLDLTDCRRILEPSCGDGAFLSAIVHRLRARNASVGIAGSVELTGIEIDPTLAARARERMEREAADLCSLRVSIHPGDFFRALSPSSWTSDRNLRPPYLRPGQFDLIVGNPPFGGTFDHGIEDRLDRSLGKRRGRKIKKETYSFFIVAAVDLLRDGGKLVFICSDSILTISTMTGLRRHLMDQGQVHLRDVAEFSEETSYPMIVLEFVKGRRTGFVFRNGTEISGATVRRTPHSSWGVTPDLDRLFQGRLLGDLFVASSGMTTGRNELFVRSTDREGRIEEPFRFEFFEAPVTVAYEQRRARLGRLSDRRLKLLEAAEQRGDTERRLRIVRRDEPLGVVLPDSRYRPYNKANGSLVFSDPTHWIYWENDGEAVLTYKKTGNWYLRGVGGQPYFGREGLTWQLVGSRFTARYLPEGYILDSGAPCAFLREGIRREELFFVLGWLLSPLAKTVLKTVINHTRNIQSKDFERMPYPWWVPEEERADIVGAVRTMIAEAGTGRRWSWSDREIADLGARFEPGRGDLRRDEARERPAEARRRWPARKSDESGLSLFA